MKITIYELLGMVKEGKKLPKKVKVLDAIYEFDDHYGDYFNKTLDRYLFVYMTSEEEWKLAYFLNTQVEILEEKRIPEKLKDINSDFYVKDCYYEKLSKEEIALDLVSLKNWINSIIDYLKSKGE